MIDPYKSKIFFLINPNGDLKRTEDAIIPFIYHKNKEKYKYKNWDGYIGNVPNENILIDRSYQLTFHSFFYYLFQRNNIQIISYLRHSYHFHYIYTS